MNVRRIPTLALLAVTAFTLACQKSNAQSPAVPEPAAMTEEQKTMYALGLMMGRNLAAFSLTPAEVELVKKGLADSAAGVKSDIQPETMMPKIQELAKSRQAARSEQEKTKGKEYAEKAAKEPGAQALPSGLVYASVTEGTGASPKATDTVKAHYHGTLTDGTVFDSSVKRGQPLEFSLDGVIPCWTEGVQKMKVGGKAKLVCPSQIAYGDMGRPPTIPGGATLVFEVELLDVKAAAAAPAAPAAPPVKK